MSEFGTAEPYVWTAFFKIDGDTVQVDLADDGRPGLFLTGVCTFVATQGSHEDLRDRSVAEGDDAPIPAELGEVRLPLTPMRATQRTGLPADFSVPGTVGVVVALLEENLASDAGAAAYYRGQPGRPRVTRPRTTPPGPMYTRSPIAPPTEASTSCSGPGTHRSAAGT
jgi:hypothetical protein